MKLVDFGFVKIMVMSLVFLILIVYVGIKIYVVLEIFFKDVISDRRFFRRVDVWSFGIMLNEIFSGKVFFF